MKGYLTDCLYSQCNEPRTEDAVPADASGSGPQFGRRGSELGKFCAFILKNHAKYVLCWLIYMLSCAGPTHVLVVRGLDENADEEMLRYEFSKHAPIKVRNKPNT